MRRPRRGRGRRADRWRSVRFAAREKYPYGSFGPWPGSRKRLPRTRATSNSSRDQRTRVTRSPFTHCRSRRTVGASTAIRSRITAVYASISSRAVSRAAFTPRTRWRAVSSRYASCAVAAARASRGGVSRVCADAAPGEAGGRGRVATMTSNARTASSRSTQKAGRGTGPSCVRPRMLPPEFRLRMTRFPPFVQHRRAPARTGGYSRHFKYRASSAQVPGRPNVRSRA